ncbi:CDP-diacylglycerol--glycerol-3-phosphate 3-phosphatidyltransferase [uncultured Rubinisphaera sp.]|uniref:CDP-diacylglycerol--glycerol-3-phosphate 3-phosphatidyltransferase n=1 Tax=uncultured Rubinisphaera sp. TaxID=1678686 RepID=UPI0030D988B4
MNSPNIISMSRLILSFVLFAIISLTDWWLTATIVFIVAVATDAVDGYLARKYNLVTIFGRILDPLVDKVIICGSFIFLQSVTGSGITPWMTLAIIVRELYITSLRGFFEQQGIDFSAAWIGKMKMVLQSIAIPFCLVSLMPQLENVPLFLITRDVILWLTIAITIYSGIEYTFRGVKLFKQKQSSE